jgi:hypothetical protein
MFTRFTGRLGRTILSNVVAIPVNIIIFVIVPGPA